MKRKTCCFLGHRKIEITDALRNKLYNVIKKLIVEENVNTFLFGSKSQFKDLCHKIVSELKIIYPHIKRIYVRAEFPYINDDYKSYLLQSYEDTYYPATIIKSWKFVYVERNYEMISQSDFCIIYFNENYVPDKQKNPPLTDNRSKSGTKSPILTL